MARNDTTIQIPDETVQWLNRLAAALGVMADRGTAKGEPSKRGALMLLAELDEQSVGAITTAITRAVTAHRAADSAAD